MTTPIIIILIYAGNTQDLFSYKSVFLSIAAFLFAVAAITDFIDGKLARSKSQVTKLGTFLDPIADKFMVCSVLVTMVLMYTNTRYGVLFAILSTVVISREILITGLREWTARIGQEQVSAVAQSGKLKAGFQMTGITMLIVGPTLSNSFFTIASIGIFFIGVILGLTSAYSYMKASIKTFI